MGLQSRRTTIGGPSLGRASPHCLSCWDQLSSAASPVTWGSNLASPCHLLSPRIRSPRAPLDKIQHKAGPYPTELHLGRILQANREGKGRDRDKCCCTNPVSQVSAEMMLFSLPLPTPTLHYLLFFYCSDLYNCTIL